MKCPRPRVCLITYQYVTKVRSCDIFGGSGAQSRFFFVEHMQVPFDAVPNGSGTDRRRPEAGCGLIWREQGHFSGTGPVAIITEVTDTYVRVAEQNVDDTYWFEIVRLITHY